MLPEGGAISHRRSARKNGDIVMLMLYLYNNRMQLREYAESPRHSTEAVSGNEVDKFVGRRKQELQRGKRRGALPLC